MIGREGLRNLASIGDIDAEITDRQTKLNVMAASLEPQILSEEIVELRLRRTEIEDQMVTRMSQSTGVSQTECRTRLLRHNWNMRAAMENMTFIKATEYGIFFGAYGHKYHFSRSDNDERFFIGLCGIKIEKRGGVKESHIVLVDHVCPICVELGLHANGVEHVERSMRALPEVSEGG